MEHVRGGIAKLLFGQVAAPQSELCCCFERSIFSRSLHRSRRPVAVGEGARQPRGDLRAIDRHRHDAEMMVEHREIEAREVKELGHPGVCEKPLQPGRAVAARARTGSDAHPRFRPKAARGTAGRDAGLAPSPRYRRRPLLQNPWLREGRRDAAGWSFHSEHRIRSRIGAMHPPSLVRPSGVRTTTPFGTRT